MKPEPSTMTPNQLFQAAGTATWTLHYLLSQPGDITAYDAPTLGHLLKRSRHTIYRHLKILENLDLIRLAKSSRLGFVIHLNRYQATRVFQYAKPTT